MRHLLFWVLVLEIIVALDLGPSHPLVLAGGLVAALGLLVGYGRLHTPGGR